MSEKQYISDADLQDRVENFVGFGGGNAEEKRSIFEEVTEPLRNGDVWLHHDKNEKSENDLQNHFQELRARLSDFFHQLDPICQTIFLPMLDENAQKIFLDELACGDLAEQERAKNLYKSCEHMDYSLFEDLDRQKINYQEFFSRLGKVVLDPIIAKYRKNNFSKKNSDGKDEEKNYSKEKNSKKGKKGKNGRGNANKSIGNREFVGSKGMDKNITLKQIEILFRTRDNAAVVNLFFEFKNHYPDFFSQNIWELAVFSLDKIMPSNTAASEEGLVSLYKFLDLAEELLEKANSNLRPETYNAIARNFRFYAYGLSRDSQEKEGSLDRVYKVLKAWESVDGKCIWMKRMLADCCYSLRKNEESLRNYLQVHTAPGVVNQINLNQHALVTDYLRIIVLAMSLGNPLEAKPYAEYLKKSGAKLDPRQGRQVAQLFDRIRQQK